MLCAYDYYVNDIRTISASSAELIISCKVLCEPVHKTICRPMLAPTGDQYFEMKVDIEAMNLILLSIPNGIYNSVDACENAKDMTCECFKSKKGLPRHMILLLSVIVYDDDYQGDAICIDQEDSLTTTMMLLARAITQGYFTPTNNHPLISSNTINQAVVQADRVDIQSINVGNSGSFVRKTTGHYARDCLRPRVEEFEDLNAIVCMMAQIQQTGDDSDNEDGGLDYISKDVDIRNLDWCTFVWDCLKDTKKPKTYYCGSVTLLMLIYLYCTKCDEVNVIRSRPAITSWTSDERQKIYHDLNVIDVGTGADANREDQEIDADMFEDIDDPTAKKTNDEDQVVEETVVVLPYKLINKLNKLLCCCQLISDLVVVIVSATCGGFAFACARQPLRIVRAVAIMGGLLQIFLFMCLSGVIAVVLAFEYNFPASTMVGGCKLTVVKKTFDGEDIKGERVFLGRLCDGFPILGGTSGMFEGMLSMTKTLVTLITFLAVLSLFSRTCIPWFFNLMISLSSQTNELYQLASVAFCLIVASSPAGVMISTTDHAQHTLEQVEPIRNFFAALFLASIGMLIHVKFLWNHIDILLAAVILVVVIKTFVVATIVKGFGYTNKTALLVRVYATSPVGMSLAQIREFAFVLLNRASNLHLIEGKLYLLLLGTTALNLGPSIEERAILFLEAQDRVKKGPLLKMS
ncbi:K(+) efflux antiporter 4 [Tanacetum coccineum]